MDSQTSRGLNKDRWLLWSCFPLYLVLSVDHICIQLFNIFLGSMSLVGPRPERPEIAEQYLEIMPQFDYRLKFKAGLTGYAQVMGKYNTTPQDKLTLDLMYIESYSILLDLKILLLTIKTVFVRESTEGIDEKATIADRPIEAADMDDKSSGQGAK